MVEIINNFIGKEFNRVKILKIKFPIIENIEVCVVDVKKNNKEVYLKKAKNNEVLIIRTEASSIELNTREAVEYIKEHWKENKTKK